MFGKWSRDLSQRLGVYKYMPVFFLFGAAIELFMIKVRVGNETFCKFCCACGYYDICLVVNPPLFPRLFGIRRK